MHPPGVKGFFWAHAGWIMSPKNQRTKVEWVPDLVKYPELVWLDRNHYVAPVTLGVALYFLGEWTATAYPALGTTGWQLVVVALFCSTTVLYHVTFAVNSVGHTLGTRRYRHQRREPQQPVAGPDHRGRGVAQQPPSIPRLRASGVLLVGDRLHPLPGSCSSPGCVLCGTCADPPRRCFKKARPSQARWPCTSGLSIFQAKERRRRVDVDGGVRRKTTGPGVAFVRRSAIRSET